MNQPTMRDADMPLLDRIDAAIKRVYWDALQDALERGGDE